MSSTGFSRETACGGLAATKARALEPSRVARMTAPRLPDFEVTIIWCVHYVLVPVPTGYTPPKANSLTTQSNSPKLNQLG